MDFSESFCHLNYEFRKKLQSEFFELVDSLISAGRLADKDGQSDDDIVQVMSFSNKIKNNKIKL